MSHLIDFVVATWRTPDGPFFLAVLPVLVVFVGMLALSD